MRRICLLSLIAGFLAACSSQPEPVSPPPSPSPAAAANPAATPADTRPVIVAFGNSLTAGHGLEPGRSYPDVLQSMLDQKGFRYRVVNQGISGDTTSGGAARIGAALALKPAIVILELGANDGLRGLPIEATRSNLESMTAAFQNAGAKVVLAGMTLPRNYGPDYIKGFEAIFRDLARQRKLALIPFFLEGVAMRPEFMQSDGLHPNAEGTRRVAQNVFQTLEPLL